MTRAARTDTVLTTALEARAFTAVVAEVGGGAGVRWRFGAGRLDTGETSPPVTPQTIFDLASLTKVLATTPLLLPIVTRGHLALDAPLAALLPGWSAPDRARVTVRQLLDHSAGLPAFREYFHTCSGRAAYESAIAAEPLVYEPGTQCLYSDLGFILLGFVLEDAAGAPLPAQFDAWRAAAAIREPLAYLPPVEWRPEIPCTGFDAWRGRLLQGEVHDPNAWALGGAAGHAGLFGSAAAVGAAARWWMTELGGEARLFAARSAVPGSSRALGWDTMLPTSSCGTRMSPAAIGHTGFTGTSLWIDPARDFYAVLLTNRVLVARDDEAIRHVRRAFHDAAVGEFAP